MTDNTAFIQYCISKIDKELIEWEEKYIVSLNPSKISGS